MYKKKLFFFGLGTAFILLIALACTAVSAHLTRQNLEQSTIAQSLLSEHQQLSSISYRLFKQLTDEIIFGKNANQANVRKKRAIIAESIVNIRRLELKQREALGEDFTLGTVEDTDELDSLITSIINEFEMIVENSTSVPIAQKQNLRNLLEESIDNEFREAINAAEVRQSRVVSSINARINALNTAIVWFTLILGLLVVPLIGYACYWLFNQLYQPLILIQRATNTIANGDYRKPISDTLDSEFQQLATSINQLAKRLQEHEANEARSRKNLEFQVEQRTSELTQANLQLTKIDSRRRQFIADVSHELRTPLTIIRGEAQVTLRVKSVSEAEYKDTLQVILDQAVNLSHLVDGLLLLTRAEMTELHLELSSMDMEPIIMSEVAKWRKLCENRNIEVDENIKNTLTKVRIDKPRIEQVFSILLDNANKYSAKNEAIKISIGYSEECINISVSDTGEGISGAEIENIFERFVRFSKHNEGVGLGLPIAKAIVEAHKGSISVNSVQGEGTTFSVKLPLDNLTLKNES